MISDDTDVACMEYNVISCNAMTCIGMQCTVLYLRIQFVCTYVSGYGTVCHGTAFWQL